MDILPLVRTIGEHQYINNPPNTLQLIYSYTPTNGTQWFFYQLNDIRYTISHKSGKTNYYIDNKYATYNEINYLKSLLYPEYNKN